MDVAFQPKPVADMANMAQRTEGRIVGSASIASLMLRPCGAEPSITNPGLSFLNTTLRAKIALGRVAGVDREHLMMRENKIQCDSNTASLTTCEYISTDVTALCSPLFGADGYEMSACVESIAGG